MTRLIGMGTAVPAQRFSQKELADAFGLGQERMVRFFRHPHIKHRHLTLPPRDPETGRLSPESMDTLLEKHLAEALKLGGDAARASLNSAGWAAPDVGYLCCVTSTGFLVPSLSARLATHLNLSEDCQRVDIVGMGCNAGLNGLQTAALWSSAHPGQKALLVCVEVCSAIYDFDESENTALVNSLFGDGAVAVLMERGQESFSNGSKVDGTTTALPEILDFASVLIPDSLPHLRFDWNETRRRFCFHVSKETPKVLAAHSDRPLKQLLKRSRLDMKDIDHWIVHSGGEAILSQIEGRLGLPPEALRHTRSILRDFGNLSSGSYLFSLDRLVRENKVKQGQYGIMMTMGPGLTIEAALVRWPR